MKNKAQDALICDLSDDNSPSPSVQHDPGRENGAQDPVDPRLFGELATEPDPYPVNHCKLAIHLEDAIKLVDWIYTLDIPIHAQITVGHVLEGLSGFGQGDLKWICRAIKQAERAPAPSVMRRALLARDVYYLRAGKPED